MHLCVAWCTLRVAARFPLPLSNPPLPNHTEGMTTPLRPK